MIRVGQTRNLLRASSSLLEIWPRSAHHHPGQRHLSGRTNRPDKSPHSITCLMFRNSLQMRAASTREGWTRGPSPPPQTLEIARYAHSLTGDILSKIAGKMRQTLQSIVGTIPGKGQQAPKQESEDDGEKTESKQDADGQSAEPRRRRQRPKVEGTLHPGAGAKRPKHAAPPDRASQSTHRAQKAKSGAGPERMACLIQGGL